MAIPGHKGALLSGIDRYYRDRTRQLLVIRKSFKPHSVLKIEHSRFCALQSDMNAAKRGVVTMFFFSTLLVGSLVFLLVLTLIYKTICIAFKSVSNFMKPVNGNFEPVTVRNGSARPQKKSKVRSPVHGPLTRLDRRNQEKVGNWNKTHPVNPDPHLNQNFEWLQRERSSSLVEDSYKVKRRCTPTPPTLDMISKPFKHKRAPWVLKHEASNDNPLDV